MTQEEHLDLDLSHNHNQTMSAVAAKTTIVVPAAAAANSGTNSRNYVKSSAAAYTDRKVTAAAANPMNLSKNNIETMTVKKTEEKLPVTVAATASTKLSTKTTTTERNELTTTSTQKSKLNEKSPSINKNNNDKIISDVKIHSEDKHQSSEAIKADTCGGSDLTKNTFKDSVINEKTTATEYKRKSRFLRSYSVDTNNSAVDGATRKEFPTERKSIKRSLTLSEDQKDEDPIARLEALKANIVNVLSEVKAVLVQHGEPVGNQRTFEEQQQKDDADNVVKFRFIRKIRKRSVIDLGEQEIIQEVPPPSKGKSVVVQGETGNDNNKKEDSSAIIHKNTSEEQLNNNNKSMGILNTSGEINSEEQLNIVDQSAVSDQQNEKSVIIEDEEHLMNTSGTFTTGENLTNLETSHKDEVQPKTEIIKETMKFATKEEEKHKNQVEIIKVKELSPEWKEDSGKSSSEPRNDKTEPAQKSRKGPIKTDSVQDTKKSSIPVKAPKGSATTITGNKKEIVSAKKIPKKDSSVDKAPNEKVSFPLKKERNNEKRFSAQNYQVPQTESLVVNDKAAPVTKKIAIKTSTKKTVEGPSKIEPIREDKKNEKGTAKSKEKDNGVQNKSSESSKTKTDSKTAPKRAVSNELKENSKITNTAIKKKLTLDIPQSTKSEETYSVKSRTSAVEGNWLKENEIAGSTSAANSNETNSKNESTTLSNRSKKQRESKDNDLIVNNDISNSGLPINQGDRILPNNRLSNKNSSLEISNDLKDPNNNSNKIATISEKAGSKVAKLSVKESKDSPTTEQTKNEDNRLPSFKRQPPSNLPIPHTLAAPPTAHKPAPNSASSLSPTSPSQKQFPETALDKVLAMTNFKPADDSKYVAALFIKPTSPKMIITKGQGNTFDFQENSLPPETIEKIPPKMTMVKDQDVKRTITHNNIPTIVESKITKTTDEGKKNNQKESLQIKEESTTDQKASTPKSEVKPSPEAKGAQADKDLNKVIMRRLKPKDSRILEYRRRSFEIKPPTENIPTLEALKERRRRSDIIEISKISSVLKDILPPKLSSTIGSKIHAKNLTQETSGTVKDNKESQNKSNDGLSSKESPEKMDSISHQITTIKEREISDDAKRKEVPPSMQEKQKKSDDTTKNTKQGSVSKSTSQITDADNKLTNRILPVTGKSQEPSKIPQPVRNEINYITTVAIKPEMKLLPAPSRALRYVQMNKVEVPVTCETSLPVVKPLSEPVPQAASLSEIRARSPPPLPPVVEDSPEHEIKSEESGNKTNFNEKALNEFEIGDTSEIKDKINDCIPEGIEVTPPSLEEKTSTKEALPLPPIQVINKEEVFAFDDAEEPISRLEPAILHSEPLGNLEQEAVSSTESVGPAPKKKKGKKKVKVVIKRVKRRLSKEEIEKPEQLVPEVCEKAIKEPPGEDQPEEEEAAALEPDEKLPAKPKSCLKPRNYEPGDKVLYADRIKKVVKWRKGTVIERITSISYKLDVEGEEKCAHVCYIKKYTDKKVQFGGKEYLEIDYAQEQEEEEDELPYNIWSRV